MFSLKSPTFFSGLGSVAFHLVFIVYSGYYIMSQDRVEPLQKKVFKLEVVKKKEPPPVEKKQIREIVKQVKMPVPSVQKVLEIQPQTKVMPVTQVSRVIPTSVPLKNIPMQTTATITKQVFVQTASVSPRFQTTTVVPRTFQTQRKMPVTSREGSLIRKSATRAKMPAFQVRDVAPDRATANNKSDGSVQVESRVARVALPKITPRSFNASDGQQSEGELKTAFLMGIAARFSAAFEPRPVPNVIDQGALNGYTRGIQQKIAARKKYPGEAKRDGLEGQVTVQFTVLKSGDIRDLVLVNRTRYELLNEAALDAVKSAAPFPGLPDEIGQDFLELVLPFKFKIKK